MAPAQGKESQGEISLITLACGYSYGIVLWAWLGLSCGHGWGLSWLLVEVGRTTQNVGRTISLLGLCAVEG